jgi:hypothetical protein
MIGNSWRIGKYWQIGKWSVTTDESVKVRLQLTDKQMIGKYCRIGKSSTVTDHLPIRQQLPLIYLPVTNQSNIWIGKIIVDVSDKNEMYVTVLMDDWSVVSVIFVIGWFTALRHVYIVNL